jgi:hypothetical protein
MILVTLIKGSVAGAVRNFLESRSSGCAFLGFQHHEEREQVMQMPTKIWLAGAIPAMECWLCINTMYNCYLCGYSTIAIMKIQYIWS